MSDVLVPQVAFTGTTTTHLLDGEWHEYSPDNWTVCGLRATTLGYYQIGMAEVHCIDCIATHKGR